MSQDGMKISWEQVPPVQVSQSLRDFVGGHPLVAETLVRRGIATVDAARAFLDPGAYTPAPATDFPDMDLAVDRLLQALENKERICVWGDFDVDGQTSTTLLVSMLRDVGADVFYHIPLRDTESHGVNLPWLERVIQEGAQLILTCDTGVDAHKPVAFARNHGVDVVITDHHELPPTLPNACAVVNPHRLPEGHPLSTLPGVGVVYKLAEAFYARLGRPGAADAFLDLVALGIVADVASQVGDARYLLQLGLESLRNTQRLGLLELFKIANLNPAQLTETSISFALAPRLNALGRLNDANISVEFFTTQDLIRARVLAVQLQGFNMERKRLCDVVFQEAQSQLRINPTLLDYDALVLENPGWHPGVIGIVANRLAELYHRPTVLLSSAEEKVRGSARSVAGCNITAAIAQQQGLLLNFGGHAMAAGVALKKSNIPEFRVQLSQAIREQMVAVTEESPSVMAIDAYLPLEAVSLSLAADLDRLAPFGAGNPQLVFATRDLRITTKKTLGAEETHLKLMVEDAHGTVLPIFWWHWRGADLPEGQFDLAYHIETTTYNGQRQLQLRWLAAQDVETSVVELQKPKTVEIVDYRGVPEPLELLEPLLGIAGVQVWREGMAIRDVPGQTRYELSGDLAVPLEQRGGSGDLAVPLERRGKVLVVWTLPPGFDEWQAVLERVKPETLYLFDVDPGAQDYQGFLQRLAGLVKHAVRANSGQAHLSVLAAAMAQRESIILTGLSWLEAQGHITIKSHSGDILLFAAGGHKNPGEVQAIMRILREQLVEVAAYRQYFANVDAARLKKS